MIVKKIKRAGGQVGQVKNAVFYKSLGVARHITKLPCPTALFYFLTIIIILLKIDTMYSKYD
jgi:hypothetical protein